MGLILIAAILSMLAIDWHIAREAKKVHIHPDPVCDIVTYKGNWYYARYPAKDAITPRWYTSPELDEPAPLLVSWILERAVR